MSLAHDFEVYRPSTASGSASRRIVRGSVRAIGGGRYSTHPKLDLFSDYEAYGTEDWDGYGAQPITTATVRAARSFYFLLPMDGPRPDIAPGADGTIGFEWRFGPATEREFILIDIGPEARVLARRIMPDGTTKSFAPTTVNTGARALIQELFTA